MERFQIRDEDSGLALVDAETGEEALLAFVGRIAVAQAGAMFTKNEGIAEVRYGDTVYRAVPTGADGS